MSQDLRLSAGNLLFFGSRNKAKDFLCKEDWDRLMKDKALQLVTAFSRDQVGVEFLASAFFEFITPLFQEDKVYVQHRISEHGKKVWELLSRENASFYVAG